MHSDFIAKDMKKQLFDPMEKNMEKKLFYYVSDRDKDLPVSQGFALITEEISPGIIMKFQDYLNDLLDIHGVVSNWSLNCHYGKIGEYNIFEWSRSIIRGGDTVYVSALIHKSKWHVMYNHWYSRNITNMNIRGDL